MTFKLFLSKKAAGFLERISNDDKRRIVATFDLKWIQNIHIIISLYSIHSMDTIS